MLYDISTFRNSCSYCYKGIDDGLSWCSCGLSTCNDHNEMHFQRFKCQNIFKIRTDSSGELCVENNINAWPDGESISTSENIIKHVKKIIKDGRFDLDDDRVICPHTPEDTPAERTLQNPKCYACETDENLWLCLECGNVGCGRSQAGKKGNGHALEHFKAHGLEHSQVVYVPSIDDDRLPDVYCYECYDFVKYPNNIPINYNNPNVQEFKNNTSQEKEKEKEAVIRKNPRFIGIRNAGGTCYISSVLQLLADLYKDYDDLPMHYELCETNPLECFCCQFIRIINTICQCRREESANGPSFLDVSPFLRLVFEEMPQYSRSRQEDSAEFLQTILLRISFYEEAGLMAPITNDLKFSIENVVSCDGCGYSNTSQTEDKILYVNHGSSLDAVVRKYFGEACLACKCGQSMSIQNIAVNPPKTLLISIKTYKMEDKTPVKITDPIYAEDITLNLKSGRSQKFTVQNCIVHIGPSLFSGHYTWWCRAGGEPVLVNDKNVVDGSKDVPEDGVIFMLR